MLNKDVFISLWKESFDNVLDSFGILFQILTPTREKAFFL